MLQRLRRSGFTLIDLLVTLLFSALLSVIAYPNLRTATLKKNQAELPTNLEAIRSAELAYQQEFGVFTACASRPASLPTINPVPFGATKGDNSDWDLLGWVADGPVRGQYAVAALKGDATTANFSASAVADMDGNGITAAYGANRTSAATQLSAHQVY